jgi:ATP-binding cassette subfamily B protein
MSSRKPTLREAAPRLGRTLRRFSHHVADQRRLLVLGSLALLAEVALRLLEPWPLAYVIDHVVVRAGAELGSGTGAGARAGAPEVGTGVLLAACALGLLAVVVLRALAAYATTVCFALAGNRVLTRVRAELYAHLNRLSMAFHDRARTGDLVTRVTGDVGRLQEATVTALLPLVGNVVTLVGMLVVVAVMDPALGLVVLVVLPFFGLINVRLTRRIAGVARQQRMAEGAIASLATESLGSMRVVHSYSLAGRLQERFGGSNERSLRDGVRAKKLSAGLERKTDVLVGVATALVLWAGGWRVLSGDLTPGELTVFLTYLKTAMKPMRDVAKYTGRIAKAAASGERIVDLLDERADLVDASGARPAPRFRGHVELSDVWVSYTPGRPALRGLDLTVGAGERVALVGASGSGKSTVVALLSRLRDPDQGSVRVDGLDLRDLTLDSVRSQVSVVLQDSVLFAVSIRENIALGVDRGVTDAEIEEAARIAGAHDFVTALPDGYDTVVGERGTTLSGGQRQRIAIARAAIRRAPIVVLDEALTGLDAETGGEVVAALRRLCEGRTTFVVTHDLEAARDADRVVWIEDGAVRLDGDPEPVLGVMNPAERV